MAPKAVLIGLPGSGKSTIGRRLAKALDVTLLDTDIAIEETTGRTIADLFANDGEKEFRRIEEQVVRTALADHDGVVSLGGGAITSAGVRDALSGQIVIYLEITASEGVRRTGGSTVRPLLAGPDRSEKFRALMTERLPHYRRVATIRINTNRRNPGAVVRYIVSRLENQMPADSTRRRRRTTWRRSPAAPAQSRPTVVAGQSPSHSSEVPPTPAIPAAMAARRAKADRHD